MQGIIIKGIAGFYYVDVAGSGIYECKAKGIFRKERIKPLVGDKVEIEILDEEKKEAALIKIFKRKNELFRPAVANVDQMMIVMALARPDPNFGVLDRLLIQAEISEVPTIICFNKADIASKEVLKACEIYKKAGYKVITASVKEELEMNEVENALKEKTTVLAGPSGVGKSSITNILAPDACMETGDISRKLKRGRHTTRHSQLIVVEDGTYICDTPGFTSFSPETIEKEELRYYFKEISQYEGKCRFNGCVHINEPGCAVKEAVEAGDISAMRYESYVQLYEEIKSNERNKYK